MKSKERTYSYKYCKICKDVIAINKIMKYYILSPHHKNSNKSIGYNPD